MYIYALQQDLPLPLPRALFVPGSMCLLTRKAIHSASKALYKAVENESEIGTSISSNRLLHASQPGSGKTEFSCADFGHGMRW